MINMSTITCLKPSMTEFLIGHFKTCIRNVTVLECYKHEKI